MRVLLLFFTVGLMIPNLSAAEYHVNKSAKNLVKFISDAPVEKIEGVTGQIDGYLYWDGDDMLNRSQLYFTVDLNSLDTGIGLRNRHMRENYLQTDQFPNTDFKGKLTMAVKVSETEYQVTAEGVLFIHGVEQPLAVQGKMIKDGDSFRIISEFAVKLSDYKIEIPSIMIYKIDETVALQVDLFVKLHSK